MQTFFPYFQLLLLGGHYDFTSTGRDHVLISFMPPAPWKWNISLISLWLKEIIWRRNIHHDFNINSPSNILWNDALFLSYFQKYHRCRRTFSLENPRNEWGIVNHIKGAAFTCRGEGGGGVTYLYHNNHFSLKYFPNLVFNLRFLQNYKAACGCCEP